MKTKYICVLFLISPFGLYSQSSYSGSGISLKFSGTFDNYIDLDDVFNTLDFPFTIEAWIKPEAIPPNRGGIFGSDNNLVNYYGFWFRLTNTLTVDFEFGDSNGSSGSNRRGFVTLDAIELHKWTHVAAVVNSVSDIHIYYNGVIATKTTTDGTSTSLLLTHNSTPATIGQTENIHEKFPFPGQIDEVRLWNVSRTQTQIRDYMCKKLNVDEPGLIGYWKNDESFISSSVQDFTLPAENGVIHGTVNKITSAAPIGDESEYMYTSDWDGVEIVSGSPGDDDFRIYNIINNPKGVQLYTVDELPNFTGGLTSPTHYYFGVFPVDNNLTCIYDISYEYDFANGVVTAANELESTLYTRKSNTKEVWEDGSAFLDDIDDKLSKSEINSRYEYIYNNSIINSVAVDNSLSNAYEICPLSISPNPVNEQLRIDDFPASTGKILITDIIGHTIDAINQYRGGEILFDLTKYTAGSYIILFEDTKENILHACRFEKYKM